MKPVVLMAVASEVRAICADAGSFTSFSFLLALGAKPASIYLTTRVDTSSPSSSLPSTRRRKLAVIFTSFCSSLFFLNVNAVEYPPGNRSANMLASIAGSKLECPRIRSLLALGDVMSRQNERLEVIGQRLRVLNEPAPFSSAPCSICANVSRTIAVSGRAPLLQSNRPIIQGRPSSRLDLAKPA